MIDYFVLDVITKTYLYGERPIIDWRWWVHERNGENISLVLVIKVSTARTDHLEKHVNVTCIEYRSGDIIKTFQHFKYHVSVEQDEKHPQPKVGGNQF